MPVVRGYVESLGLFWLAASEVSRDTSLSKTEFVLLTVTLTASSPEPKSAFEYVDMSAQ